MGAGTLPDLVTTEGIRGCFKTCHAGVICVWLIGFKVKGREAGLREATHDPAGKPVTLYSLVTLQFKALSIYFSIMKLEQSCP